MARLALLDTVYLLLGLGLLPALGVTRSRRELLRLAPAALFVGLAAGGLLAAEFALLDAPLTLGELAFAAVLALAVGGWRLRRSPGGVGARGSRLDLALAAVPALAAAVLVLRAAPAFAVRPLLEWDGWAIWGTKAQALADLHGVRNGVFESGAYPHPDYPILLPALEAVVRPAGWGAVHVQLLVLVAAFAAALWALLRGRAPAALVALAILAVVAAPYLLDQLAWNYADVPLACTATSGTVALLVWSEDGDRGMLVLAAIFLAAAALTKNEGLLFGFAALTAAAAAALLARRSPLPLVAVAGFVVLAVLPWRVFVHSHRLPSEDFDLANLVHPGYLGDHSGRIWPAAGELWTQMTGPRWGYLVLAFFAATACALLAGRVSAAAFALIWFALSFGGLVAIYWIQTLPLASHLSNSSYRTVATLAVGRRRAQPAARGPGSHTLRPRRPSSRSACRRSPSRLRRRSRTTPSRPIRPSSHRASSRARSPSCRTLIP